ncbi:hypothetical protein QAD02_021447 [Eretmocerus hayati]|uniref:Uncharacterized protein n=1 Tax=Eretmocerus hayati TaxID=131215 RepID=A0ACC2PSS6_9HYME|nr:hypothetical protein QAD02_021447 [Eretmocerus hayati]
MNKTGAGVSFLREKFPRLSEAKLKEGVLVGPDIGELMLDSGFDTVLNEVELKIWKSVKNVINSYLGNRKSENYETLVRDMLQNFQQMKGNQSLEIHMLDSHLVFFPDNLGAVSDEHGERFHQEIATLENRYNSKKSVNMLADYCWNVVTEGSSTHRRKSARKSFVIADSDEE